MKQSHQTLRQRFAAEIFTAMKNDERIVVVTGDLGYRVWDQVRETFPDRFYNVGAGEQALIGIAVGLSLGGKIPVVYSITPFLLYRPFETIRNYVDHEKIKMILVGSGRDKDYLDAGFSHWAQEDREVMKIFKNITSVWPESVDEVSALIPKLLASNFPWYINVSR